MSVGFLVNFVNNTSTPMSLTATVASDGDWASKTTNRPDKDIKGLRLEGYAFSAFLHEERANYRATAPFTVTATYAGGEISFVLDGCDGPNMAARGVIPILKGSDEFCVIQVTTAAYETDKKWNTMTVFITPLVNPKKWMAQFPNRTLTELCVPGTHNSGTYGGNGEMGTRCQTMTLKDQLESGIRFFDLRLVQKDVGATDLGVFHANYFQNLWLGKDLLPVIAQFLADNADECVILCANRAHDKGEPFDTLLKTLLDDNLNALYDDDDSVFHEQKLSDLRGKVVVVRRSSPVTFGLEAMPWPDDEADATISPFAKDGRIRLQDAYEYGIKRLPSITYLDKWKNIEAHLERALEGPSTDWFLNFTSASHSPPTALYYPWDFATGQGQYGENYLLSRYLVTRTASTSSYLGTIVMDFPEEPADKSLIRLLLAMNV